MGDKNVIALLTSINGNLKKIVETSQTNATQSKEEVTEQMTQALNTGTVLTGDAVKPKAEQGKIGDIVISAATVASLKTLPVVLLAFSKVKEKDLDSFVKTLETIKDAVDSFSDIKSLDKSIKTLNDVSNFMLILEKTNFSKAAVSVKAANALGFTSGLTHIIEGIVEAVDKAGDISNNDIKKLEAAMKSTEVLNSLVKSVGLVVLSVGGLALLIKTVGLKEVLTAAGVSMGILVALSGLAIGIAAVTKNIQGSTKSLDGISGFILKMQGIVLTTLAVGVVASMAWPEIIKGFAATAGIILGYTLVAALVSGLGKFIAADNKSFDVIPKMAAWGMAITLGTLLMGVLASKAWPEILIGFAAVSGVILGYTAIAALVSVVGKLSPTFKKDIAAITFMSGAAIALTLATTLLGYVAELAWPQILYGFTATSAIILGYTEVAALASKSAKGMQKAAKDFITIGAVIAGAELLLLGAIGLGKLLENSSPGALAAAIAGIGGIIFAIDGVAKIAQKHTKTLGKAHINFAIAAGALASSEAIVLAALGISKLVKSEKDVYAALGVLAATGAVTAALIKILKEVETSKKTLSVGAKNLLLVAGAALAAESIILGSVLIGKLAKAEDILPAAGVLLASGAVIGALIKVLDVISKNNTSIATGAKSLMMVAGVALAAEGIILGSILIGKLVEKDPWVILEAATVLGAAGGVIYGLVSLIKVVEKHNKDLAKGAKSLMLAAGVALAAEGVILGAIGLGLLYKKDPELIGYSTLVLGMAGGVVLGLVGLVKLVEKHNKDLTKGSKNLLKVALVAAAAEGLVLGAVLLAKTQKEAGVTGGEIIGTITTAAGVVTAFGALALVAGSLKSTITKGIPAMACVEALALGATAIVFGIVKLLEVKNNANIDWSDVFITIGAMATTVVAFGALAAVAGIPQVTALMLLGSVGLGAATLLALGATGLMFKIVELIDEKNKANVEWEDVFTTIGAMSTVVGAFEILAGIAGLATPFILLGIPAMAAVTGLAYANVEVLRSLVNVAAAVKELGPDGWSQISTAVTTMTNIISNDDKNNPGFAELSKKATANLITISLGAVALKEVAVTANVAAGALIQMCNAAAALKDKQTSDITNVISVFDAVTDSMYDMVGLKFMAKVAVIGAARSSINKITLIAADISKAMSDMAMVAGPNGLIRSATVTKDGRVVYGEWVDCAASADTLANSMGSFVTILHESFKDTTKDSFELIEQGMKMMANIISPVSTFAETLAGFEGQDGKIRVIKYDDNGNQIETPYVDVRSVAQSIANSISTFCGVLFSAENQSIWERMTKGGVNIKSGKEGEGDMYSPSATEAAMGIFATIVDPIGNFTSTLAMFSDGDGSNLMMPVYDSEGNLKETRVVNVVNAATTIGNAVSTFIKTLASQSADWMNIYKSYERGGLEYRDSGFLGLGTETVDTRHNIFADAMGVFSSVITPVVSFANMIAMFESGSDNILITIDASTGEKRKVDVEKVALLIGGAITTMITKLGATFSTQANNLKTISTNQQAIVEIMNGMSGAIAGIGDVDATNANNVIEAYSALLAKVLSLSTTGEIVSLKDSNASLSELRTNISALGNKNITVGLNNTVDVFNKMNTSLKNVKESVDVIDKLKTSIDTLSSSEGPDSSFDKLSNSVSSFFNIFKDPNFGDVSMATSAIDKILSHIGAAVTGKGSDVPAHIKKAGGIEGLNNKMSDSFLTVKSSLHKFDAALDSGNEKRIKNIKSIAAAVKELNDESTNARDNLTAIKDVLNAIAALSAKSSNGELSQVVNSLNSISIGGGGSGGGGGTSKNTIVSAVQEALDGMALTGQIPTISVDRMGKITAKDSQIELEIDIDKKED
jgi:hypothetical protein